MASVATLNVQSRPAYAIEDGVPVPAVRNGGGPDPGSLVQALRSLSVGQSFVVPDKSAGKMGPYFFSARKVDRSRRFIGRAEGSGCRVWRIA